jgi:hypothetical protein
VTEAKIEVEKASPAEKAAKEAKVKEAEKEESDVHVKAGTKKDDTSSESESCDGLPAADASKPVDPSA